MQAFRPHRSRQWIGAVLLPLAWSACAEEPAPVPVTPPAGEVAEPAGTRASPPAAFDLRSPALREIVRNTAASQASSGYRIEASRPARTDADIAAILREERPVPAKPDAPRLPERPPRCDGFWSCGLEAVLGLEDASDETYGRVERDRLMKQGSFNDPSKINATVPLPPPPGQQQRDSAPHRP